MLYKRLDWKHTIKISPQSDIHVTDLDGVKDGDLWVEINGETGFYIRPVPEPRPVEELTDEELTDLCCY